MGKSLGVHSDHRPPYSLPVENLAGERLSNESRLGQVRSAFSRLGQPRKVGGSAHLHPANDAVLYSPR
jgi:hypothetical protein